MTDVEYPDVEDLLRFVALLGVGPVRDLGLLEAAAARARASVFGEDAYPTVELKAAALLHSLCSNHALVDGNKRLGLLVTVTFLRMNGRAFSMSQEAAFDLVWGVADGTFDVPAIAIALTN